ncbi:MAG: hypothetical protein JO287_23780 [Pseudonocardiales bacterium]|nr:hypothetical protein [Pseudonocardiales bacterium]
MNQRGAYAPTGSIAASIPDSATRSRRETAHKHRPALGLGCSIPGHVRKTNALDAASVAAIALHHPQLHLVCAEDHSVGLRLLSDHPYDLTEERIRTANRYLPGPRSHRRRCHTAHSYRAAQ